MKVAILCLCLYFMGLSSWSLTNGQTDFNEVHGAIAAKRQALGLRRSDPIDDESVQKMVLRDLSGSYLTANLTELRFIQHLLEKKDDISVKLVEERGTLDCLVDVTQFYNDLLSGAPYALQARASFGKLVGIPSESVYLWNLEYLGRFEVCQSVNEDHPDVTIETMYCTEHFPVTGTDFFIKRGTCYPVTCSNQDLNVIFNTVAESLGADRLYGSYFTCVRDIPWTWDAILVISLLGFFTVLVAVGTIYDLRYPLKHSEQDHSNNPVQGKDKEEPEIEETMEMEEDNGEGPKKHQSQQQLYMTSEEEAELEKETAKVERDLERSKKAEKVGFKDRMDGFLRSCSLVHNCGKILSAKSNSNSLASLNGIRVFSMLWIIWGHSNQFPIGQRLDNPKYILEDLFSKFWYNSTLFGSFAVDSFFVLSGLLVAYLTLKELRVRSGNLNWFLYYFHRFWRLTPTYMIAIGIWASLAVHIGQGSDKEEAFAIDKELCADYWWTNLLYVNNLVPYNGILGGCMGWSWYLANDMQFYVISPLFILLLYSRKTKNIGLATVGFFCASSCIITAALTGYYGLPVDKSLLFYNNRTESLEQYGSATDVTYGKPWCRIQSYLVGVFTGYALYKHMHFKKIKMYWVTNVVIWVLAIGIMFAMVYGLHGTSADNRLSQWFGSIWVGTSRFFFSIGVAWVAFACSIGYGGLINSFLSWSFWTPLARLTYGAYLLHPIVIFLFLRTKKTTFHWTVPEITYFFFANVVTSYLFALCLSLLVEAPTMGLEKAVFRQRKRTTATNQDEKKTPK